MQKIEGIAVSSAQLAVLQRMQQATQVAGASATAVAPAQFFSAQMKGGETLSFSGMLNQAINSVDNVQHVAAARQTAVDKGLSDDLTGALVESQKASVSFAAMVQVRNKLTTALDEIMNMAV